MKVGPDIALIASLMGDPARANMLTALMSGRALTASELAREAGITAQTASSHLAKLEAGGLILQEKQGRHRYYALAGPDVAGALESLMGLAARAGHLRLRTGPADPALRRARVCYDHLAGDMAVQLMDALLARKLVARTAGEVTLTRKGAQFFREFGVDSGALARGRRPLCKPCLDWSARRAHLAGALGAAVLSRIYDLGWARLRRASRIVTFSPRGLHEFERLFGAGRRNRI
jgi:DNA-binding transcriptional ArsR family regulator